MLNKLICIGKWLFESQNNTCSGLSKEYPVKRSGMASYWHTKGPEENVFLYTPEVMAPVQDVL